MKKIRIIILLLFLSISIFAREKPIITVLDFNIDGVSKNEMRSIISFLSSALFKTGKFVIIDVQERDNLLKELEFSLSGCSDESCLLEIGKLLAAEYIVTGNIGKVGTRYLLSIKMLETETGRTSNTVDGVYFSIDEIVDDLYTLAAGLAEIDAGDLVLKDVESDVSSSDKKSEDDIARTDEKVTDSDTVSPDSIDTVIVPDTDGEKTRSIPARIAIGIGAGATFPLGILNTALESTFTPFTFIDYLFPGTWGYIGIGLFLGYQSEKTTPEYPDYNYQLLSVPVALHTRAAINMIKPLFFSVDVSIGGAMNNVDYEEGAVTSDLMTTKLFLSGSVGVGVSFGSYFRLSVYNTLFLIMFDRTGYSADSVGLACEFHF